MNLKLTKFRKVPGGLSDPAGFDRNFVFEKIRLMRKQRFAETKNGRILYISLSLKMFFKMHWGYVSEAQMLSMGSMALLFCSMDSLDMVLHSKNLFEG